MTPDGPYPPGAPAVSDGYQSDPDPMRERPARPGDTAAPPAQARAAVRMPPGMRSEPDADEVPRPQAQAPAGRGQVYGRPTTYGTPAEPPAGDPSTFPAPASPASPPGYGGSQYPVSGANSQQRVYGQPQPPDAPRTGEHAAPARAGLPSQRGAEPGWMTEESPAPPYPQADGPSPAQAVARDATVYGRPSQPAYGEPPVPSPATYPIPADGRHTEPAGQAGVYGAGPSVYGTPPAAPARPTGPAQPGLYGGGPDRSDPDRFSPDRFGPEQQPDADQQGRYGVAAGQGGPARPGVYGTPGGQAAFGQPSFGQDALDQGGANQPGRDAYGQPGAGQGAFAQPAPAGFSQTPLQLGPTGSGQRGAYGQPPEARADQFVPPHARPGYPDGQYGPAQAGSAQPGLYGAPPAPTQPAPAPPGQYGPGIQGTGQGRAYGGHPDAPTNAYGGQLDGPTGVYGGQLDAPTSAYGGHSDGPTSGYGGQPPVSAGAYGGRPGQPTPPPPGYPRQPQGAIEIAGGPRGDVVPRGDVGPRGDGGPGRPPWQDQLRPDREEPAGYPSSDGFVQVRTPADLGIEMPRPKRHRLRVVGWVALALLVLVGIGGALWYTAQSNGPSYKVGSCVAQKGSGAVEVACTAPNAFKVASKVTDVSTCPDVSQPYVKLTEGGRTTFVCLMPAH